MFNSQTFFGTDGILTLSDAEPFDGEKFVEYFGDSGIVGRVTDVSVSITTDVKEFHELGSRAPRELRAGNISIRGTVERAFINGAMLALMLGEYAANEETELFRIPSFNMKVSLDNLVAADDQGNSVLTIFGVIFDSWTINVPENEFVLEKLSFKARRINAQDTQVEA